MLNKLSNKLVVTLLSLLLLLSASFIAFALWSTPLFLQELNQKLNLNLANNILKEKKLFVDNKVNDKAMQSVFMGLMVVNPMIEVYLVDPKGKILAFAAPTDVVKRKQIDIEPIKKFIDQGNQLPVLGDDPRDELGNKVFSAAAITKDNNLQGYLYVVLGGQAYDSAVELIKSSYMVRLMIGAVGISLLIASLAGFFIFRLITRRLHQLSSGMEAFKESKFKHSVSLDIMHPKANGDEISQLGNTFSEMSETIIQQMYELEQSDSSRRELVANVSHDLRTPLAALQGYLETMSLKFDDLSDEDKKNYITIAWQQSQRLKKLISELFELSQLENKETKLSLEQVSMSELVQDVAQKFQLIASRKQITLETKIPAEAAFVSADISLLQRVLENLIDNAIKYTPKHGHINVELDSSGNYVAIRVQDDGYGIPQKDIPHIFERFYRVDKHRDASGTGLGLAIANRIIKLHNSNIDVDSRPNSGTTFSFRLPGMDLSLHKTAVV